MPEGHTTHRLARLHRGALAGRPVRACSPQGRFAHGAALLDGRVLEGVEAYGKHLLYAFAGGRVLHVHLGLVGSFAGHRGRVPEPGAAVRLRLAVPGAAVDLVGPMVCEVIDEHRAAALLAPLGPDPLRADTEPDRARAALERRRQPIGAALLDQSVIAGVGNVFRAESLFVHGIHPRTPAAAVARDGFAPLWRTLRRMLRQGERSGRIVTVEPSEVGAPSRARVPDSERVYVYRRAGLPCRRCGATIATAPLAGRPVYCCPVCQHT